MSTRTINVLLVEDNMADAELIRECLSESTSPIRLHVVRDGEMALNFLRKEGSYNVAPQPSLILLDLNLPKRDGREVLAEIKKDPQLKRVPVIVFTTSDAPSDILKAYDLHANCYLTKPVKLDQFVSTLQLIRDFWLNLVKLPPH